MERKNEKKSGKVQPVCVCTGFNVKFSSIEQTNALHVYIGNRIQMLLPVVAYFRANIFTFCYKKILYAP